MRLKGVIHMSGYKRIAALLAAAVLALTAFPFAAPAAGEDVLEAAPEVILPQETAVPETAAEENLPAAEGADEPVTASTWWNGDPYLPDLYSSGYRYTEEAAETDSMWYGGPGLEPSEYRRAMKLLAAVEAGEKSLEDLRYPEQPYELKIGVYPLDPADFNGETYYVLLPDRRLKDSDLLYLISCFRELGIPFEPKEWNSRNCQRGFSVRGATRELSEEESIRMDALRHRTANGLLTEADIHPESECRSIRTVYGPFCFYFYRRMTDDELAAFALVRDPVWPDAPDEVEKTARKSAADVMKLPLSMKLTETELSRISYSDTIEGYLLTFRIESVDEDGRTLQTDGEPQEVGVYLRRRADHSGLVCMNTRVYLYTDYLQTYTSENEDGQPDEDELLGIGKQWFRDNMIPDEAGFSWSVEKNEQAVPYWVRAVNDVWDITLDIYPDGTVVSVLIKPVLSPEDSAALEDLRNAGTQDMLQEDPGAAGTPPVSLEELLEQATQAPPAEAPQDGDRPETEETAAAETASGLMAGSNYTWSEDPYLPDLYTPDYRHPEEPDEYLMYNNPWLEPGELARAKELLAAVEAGEQSAEDLRYPEYPDELRVGVYPLDPAEFGGETYFVTLPARKLKDYDLLYLISCFRQLGAAFEPEALNSRNCQRAFWTRGATRDLTPEESSRMDVLRHQVICGMLKDGDVRPETECRTIGTWFGPFSFYPYRRMTDDELAAFALSRESAWDDDPDEVERTARKFAGDILELPLTMELSEAERFRISYTDITEGYGVTFRAENTDAEGTEPVTDGSPREVYVYLRKRQDNGALAGDTARVDYAADPGLYITETHHPLSEAERLETGKQWFRDHLGMDDSSFTFGIMETGWNSSFSWVWAEPADFSWYYFVTISPGGVVESFSAQKMQ